MKKVILLLLSSFTISFAKDKFPVPEFLGVVKGNIIPYLKEVIPNLKIKNVFQMSDAYTAGSLYIAQNYKNYADFYVDIEHKSINDLRNIAEEKCSKYPFYGLDNFEVSITRVSDNVVLVKTTCNIICAGF